MSRGAFFEKIAKRAGFFMYCYVVPNKRAGRKIIMNSINEQGENDRAGRDKL